ncbi:MAG: hypothetical protein Q8O64_02465 [Sideroxyarcus sp.]|nr:hypothetical protein [Sideroxyarcus sp.]
MPILQRIELSNFLNIKRTLPWQPGWVHQVLEINGENAALNIPNGGGKSTMVTAILAMITNHRKSLSTLRANFFAPAQTGHYTHIRIQVIIPTPGASGDLITNAGGELGGQPMVFGMYGNSGENEKLELYSYQGVFEDAPVAHVHNMHHTFVADDAFLGQLKACSHLFPNNAKERTKRAWQSYVEDFFDVSSIKQQLGYQLLRGAEGGHGYFEVTPPAGMSYSAGVFYERLAPELLTDVMGDLGEEGEHGIEDTIHEKASKVIAAKRETERKAAELHRTANTLNALASLFELCGEQKTAKDGYDQHRADFSRELAVLRNVVIDAPIPGVLMVPPESVPAIARSMVMQDDKWYLPDRVMAEVTGDDAKHANERAQRNGIGLAQTSRSQLIDFACDLKLPVRTKGHASQLYSRDSSLELLKITSNFAGEWTRKTAIDAVTQAFDWVEANADTNPARALQAMSTVELDAKNAEREKLSAQFHACQNEKNDLITEQSHVGEQQVEFRRMSSSGLFSEEELQSPAATGIDVQSVLLVNTNALNDHNEAVSRLVPVYESWQEFVREYGQSARPAALADEIANAVNTAKQSVKDARGRLNAARLQRKPLDVSAGLAKDKFNAIATRLAKYSESLPAFTRFTEIFGNVSPVGMEKKVVGEMERATQRLSKIEVERNRYGASLQALAAFRSEHGDVGPDEWLQQGLARWDALGAEIVTLSGTREEARIRRSALDKAVIVAGRVARDAASVAGGNHEPLHAAIARMGLKPNLREKALTIFSALLHTPVYATVSEAADAAHRLETAGIEAPVFSFPELEDFCRTGDISVDSVSAHTWLVGVRTRQVECLLDPTLVEREKTVADAQIKSLSEDIETKEQERCNHSPQSVAADQARLALEALKNGYEAKDSALAQEASTLTVQLPDLETKASNVEVIRLAERHFKEFSGAAEDELAREHESYLAATQLANEQYEANEALIVELEDKLGDQQNLFVQAAANESKVDTLRKIQVFMDDPEFNPAYMGVSAATEVELKEARDRADKRSRFQFELAETFIRTGYDRPLQIEARLKVLSEQQEEISTRLRPALDHRIKELQDGMPDLIKNTMSIDSFVHSLIRQYREFASEQHDPLPITQKQIESHPLGSAAIGMRDADASLKDRMTMLLAIAGEIQIDEASGLKAEMKASRERHQSAVRDFGRMVDNVLSMENLDMTEHVRLELARAKESPDIVARLHKVAQQNYEKNSLANATAASYLDEEWGNIGKWLKSFTQRLPDNLKTMKSLFAPIKDPTTGQMSAGYEIDAELASQDDIRAILDDVVRMVEKFEVSRQVMESAAPGIREQAIRSIRAEIRNTFYRKVILNPRIRVYMPSISPRPLPLEKSMVSTGQGVAMTLLWVVRMADYVTERELHRVTTSRAQQKRLHPTQFAIMDGAFSSLSDESLIKDALDGIKRTRGRFQLIITGHDKNYQNNFDYFPTLIEARVVDGQFMYADSETRRKFQPEEVGSHFGAMGVMSLRVKPAPDAVAAS